MPDVGEVKYSVSVDNSGVNADIGETESKFKSAAKKIDKASDDANKNVAQDFEDSAKKSQSSWSSAAKKIASGIGKAFVGMTAAGASGIAALGAVGVDFNSQMEGFQTSFEVMTGSAEEAVRITEQLKDTAAKTPFSMTDLADTTQLLMNYGLSADEAMSSMEMLGDISQGSAEKMSRVAMAYGQMSSAGKVQLEDIKQMIEAGFNPLQEISETTGESMESLYDRISKGSISVDEITASMKRSTSEGGKYFKSMEKQSQTLSGQFSTFKDNFDQFAGEVTSSLTPALTDAMSEVGEVFENPAIKESLSSTFEGIGQIAKDAIPQLVSVLGELLPPLMTFVGELMQPLSQLFEAIMPQIQRIVEELLPPLMEILEVLIPPVAQLVEKLLPPLIDILIAVITPLSDILSAILPPLLDILNMILDPILDLIDVLLPPLSQLLNQLAPLFEALTPVITALASVFTGRLSAAIKAIEPILETLMSILSGLIDFITGVFSGNWEKAWDGIVDMFKGIINIIPSAVEGVINGAIGLINGIINGINGLTSKIGIPNIPNIPEVQLPRLKAGIDYVPEDDFPALLHKGERVLTKGENMLYNAMGGVSGMASIKQAATSLQSPSIPSASLPQSSVQTIALKGDVVMDGRKVGTVVWRNIDDVAGPLGGFR